MRPRVARRVAWLAVFVFGIVVPAHLGGSDHHHHHHHHHHDHHHHDGDDRDHGHGADVGASHEVAADACDPRAHETDDHHHRGHDHQLLIPGKGGSHTAKSFAAAQSFGTEIVPSAAPRVWSHVDPRRAPGRIDRDPARPRGPPPTTYRVV